MPLQSEKNWDVTSSGPAFCPSMSRPVVTCDENEDEIDLLECWRVIWSGRKLVVFVTGICGLIAVLVSLFVLPVTYQSMAVLRPVITDHNDLGKLSAFNGTFSSMLEGGDTDGKSQQLVVFLSSSNLKQRLIEKYALLSHFNKDIWDVENKQWTVDVENQPTVVKALQKNVLDNFFTVVKDEKTGLITLTWVDQDAVFAAKMLTRVIDELNHYLEFEYETDAHRERVFIEGRLEKAKADLTYWEERIPNAKLTQGAIQREMVASQLVYQELRKQLEMAKIQEAKQVVSFKVLDQPFVPEIKYRPKRALICMATVVAAGFISIVILFVRRNHENSNAAEN